MKRKVITITEEYDVDGKLKTRTVVEEDESDNYPIYPQIPYTPPTNPYYPGYTPYTPTYYPLEITCHSI